MPLSGDHHFNILAFVPLKTFSPISPVLDRGITARAIVSAVSEALLHFKLYSQESSMSLEFLTHNSQVSIAKVFKEWASGQQRRCCVGAEVQTHPDLLGPTFGGGCPEICAFTSPQVMPMQSEFENHSLAVLVLVHWGEWGFSFWCSKCFIEPSVHISEKFFRMKQLIESVSTSWQGATQRQNSLRMQLG